MGKKIVIHALALLMLCPVAGCHRGDLRQEAKNGPDAVQIPDKSRKDACDCCEKCKAAKRPIKPKEEEIGAKTDGCKECCNHCGTVLHPLDQDVPPDLIERRTPDIIEKAKP